MTDLSEIVAGDNLNQNDKLLFTYFGSGDFLILIFDNSNVEKLLNPESDDESGNMPDIHSNILLPIFILYLS